jgi:antitoxin MazE
MTTAVITKWGNSHALRLPSKMVKELGIDCNDKVYLETIEDKIIITKMPAPKKGTLEYLFKDYSGESFKTALINPVEPVGNEKW